jgi:hypothetical protein
VLALDITRLLVRKDASLQELISDQNYHANKLLKLLRTPIKWSAITLEELQLLQAAYTKLSGHIRSPLYFYLAATGDTPSPADNTIALEIQIENDMIMC